MNGEAPDDLFDAAARSLAEAADFTALEARGLLRQILESVGLRTELLTHAKLAIVFGRILPRELPGHNLEEANAIGDTLLRRLPRMPAGAVVTPEAMFRRINRDEG